LLKVVELFRNALLDDLHQGLFGFIALEYKDVAILVMGLETSVVPVLNKMMAQVHN
jgi:hypothetical protein